MAAILPHGPIGDQSAGPHPSSLPGALAAPQPSEVPVPAPSHPLVAARPILPCPWDRRGSCLALTLNRAGRHNAFSAEMRDALVAGLEIAVAGVNSAVVVVVLKGRGSSFRSGGDLDAFGTLPDPATAHAIRSTPAA